MWRYVIVNFLGGVYSDMDTLCLKPISRWTAGFKDVSMIIGLEVDACDPNSLGGRCVKTGNTNGQVQIVQWTFAAAPHHTILDKVIQRIEANTGEYPETGKQKGVMDWTGPALFTDVIMEYFDEKFGVKPKHFSGMRKPIQMGDVLVMPLTPFSPDVDTWAANHQHIQAHWSSINSLDRGNDTFCIGFRTRLWFISITKTNEIRLKFRIPSPLISAQRRDITPAVVGLKESGCSNHLA